MRAAGLLVGMTLWLKLGPLAFAQDQESGAIRGSQPLPALPSGAFTVVVIPDTQHYTGAGTKVSLRAGTNLDAPVTNVRLEAQVRWIREHLQREKIVFVTHVGDIVEKNRPEEWTVAKLHLDTLRGLVPFSLTVGNHDMTTTGDTTLFQNTFPVSSFRSYPWYLESYQHNRADQHISANNVNSAQVFSADGIDFLHVSLECNAPDDVLEWANALISRNAQRRVLITSHMDLGIRDKPQTEEGYIHDPKGRMRWTKIHGKRGNNAEQMWDKCYRKHPNLLMVLSGDQSRVTALHLTDLGDSGNPVHRLLSDYQSEPVLRLLRFVPAENRIDVVTYDISREILVDSTTYVAEREWHQFELPCRLVDSGA